MRNENGGVIWKRGSQALALHMRLDRLQSDRRMHRRAKHTSYFMHVARQSVTLASRYGGLLFRVSARSCDIAFTLLHACGRTFHR